MNGYLAKASEALASAHLLLEAGQLTGAANRAYYAFFHVAQATIAEVAGINPRTIKTHRGLWTQFNLNIVSAGLIDKEVAAYVSAIESTRITATSLFSERKSRLLSSARRILSIPARRF